MTREFQKAFAAKDPAYDGLFFVGVKTTGIFCRPVCHAKPAHPRNLEFFRSAADALAHGYRPCKLCRPLETSRRPPVVARLLELADQTPGRWTERRLRSEGIDPSAARRQFNLYCGMTFMKYQRTKKIAAVVREVPFRSNSSAAARAGYQSTSGFRDALLKTIGPVNGAKIFTSDWIDSPLGTLLAVVNDDGLAALEFFDAPSAKRMLDHLRRRLGSPAHPAAIVPGRHKLLDQTRDQLNEYFTGQRKAFSIPVLLHGTNFQQSAWRFLQSIPFGQTRSYGDQARATGQPQAVRAVGRANGTNTIAIIIPCHRVIGADGKLTGYASGINRKQWLLDHEGVGGARLI